ncbi:hypothetical protein [Sphingomonas yabuuchiae]|uniref:hypothetical protein n=1 Tax=Sphingomonas yabuuchiae TaxID=172044 RepID=UPI003D986C70
MSAARKPAPVTLDEVDPDFAQAFRELRYQVDRHHQLRAMILHSSTDPQHYQNFGQQVAERSEIYRSLDSQAKRMNIGSAYALMHLVDVVAGLTRTVRGRQKAPAARDVLARLADEVERAKRDAEEAKVEYLIRRRMAQEAASRVTSTVEALRYVEASLG